MSTILTHDGVRITGVYPTPQAAEQYQPGASIYTIEYDLSNEDRRQLAYWIEQDKGRIDFSDVVTWLRTHVTTDDVISRITPKSPAPTINMEEAYIGGAQGDRSYMPAAEVLATNIDPSQKRPLFRALNHKTFRRVENRIRPTSTPATQAEYDHLTKRATDYDAELKQLIVKVKQLRESEMDDETVEWINELQARAVQVRSRRASVINRRNRLTWTYTIETEHTFWSEQPAQNLSGYRRIIAAVLVNGPDPDDTATAPTGRPYWQVVYAEERTAKADWIASFTGQAPGKAKWLRYWHPMVVLDHHYSPDQAGSIEAEQAAITWADCIRMDETDRYTPDVLAGMNLEIHHPGRGRTSAPIIALTDFSEPEDDDTESEWHQF